MANSKFYDREDLKSKDIVDLIGIWEGEAGESFTDYCSFSRESDKNFLEFLEKEYPVLYDYHKEVEVADDWIENTIQYIIFHCENYITRWAPYGKFPLHNLQLQLAMYPLAEFILKDDIAWQEFKDFFMSEDNTVSGTPYIDCYNIRKDFEDGRF